ncbi:MAG TPA: Gfo/Idh/MocA family oxidoreductase [Acidobacteriota bacterium]|nr:Gfo/Idh/MocA family oxidoreductase [Acidobacteriota bacterium]
MNQSRRTFVRRAATAATALSLPGMMGARRRVAPSDRIRVGVIGCRGMGFTDLSSMLKLPDIECAALCDVDETVLVSRAGEVEEATSMRPDLYGDYRALLDDDEIDAVIIGTPDHWHCLPMVDACEAGKDVYVEKPLANTIEECEIMVAAARRYDRVVQMGQWQRSGQHWMDAVDYLRAGHIGRVRTVRAWAYMNWLPEVPLIPDEPVPPGVDYDMWLGPAPSRPFNKNRFHFNFRWFWDYAGGLMTDWGVHLIDIVLWGMQVEAPLSVVATGGKFAYPHDQQETPDTMQAVYEFEGFSMMWEHAVGIGLGPFQRSHGVAFVGENGTLVVDRDKWEVLPETSTDDDGAQYKTPALPVQLRDDGGGLDEHTANFVECMKSRARPRADVQVGRDTAVVSHLGNVAFRTGDRVKWDPATVRFVDHPEADAYLKARYRAPWELPCL